jgi:tetratricopeptide (TPR) repeat protein
MITPLERIGLRSDGSCVGLTPRDYAESSRAAVKLGERPVREAVALAEQTDGVLQQGDALFDLADVLEAAGRTEEALSTFERALERYERKRVVVMETRACARLAELRRSERVAERA